jgi:hypothetical protein
VFDGLSWGEGELLKARKGLATIATFLALLNVVLLVDLAAHSDRVTGAPQRTVSVLAAALLTMLAGMGVLAAADLWKGNTRGRLTGTVLFALMAASAALKWWLQGAPSPLLRGSIIGLWICLAVIAMLGPNESAARTAEKAVEQ